MTSNFWAVSTVGRDVPSMSTFYSSCWRECEQNGATNLTTKGNILGMEKNKIEGSRVPTP